jgi:heparosan-N-sulfate-glucuronate 5-epimerase
MPPFVRKFAARPISLVYSACRPIALPLSSRGPIVSLALIGLLLISCTGPTARADYFPKDNFERYRSVGRYPFWNSTWLSLDPRLRFDSQGMPFVEYGIVASYNPVTIAAFGLLAYNRFEKSGKPGDRDSFLKMADWLVAHQDVRYGCWYYDFDFVYLTLDETISKPWISGMGQGLAISVMTRAYFLTKDPKFVRVAERALLPFHKDVETGGIKRAFFPTTDIAGTSELVFYEEYPTKRTPSFTLNGFMFALVGLCDLADLMNEDAGSLFRQGLQTLKTVLPLYDLGDGSSYDLGHLTHPPNKAHRDAGYHLIHITLLNALGTVTGDQILLGYRDHWNSYGTFLSADGIWLKRAVIWLLRRWPALTGSFALVCVAVLFLLVRNFTKRKAKSALSPSSLNLHGSRLLRAGQHAACEQDAHGPAPSTGISQ